MESFLENYDPMWVDLLSILIPVFLSFIIGFFFASIAENMRNRHLKKKLVAKTEEFDRTESELKEILNQYNILKNRPPEKVEVTKDVYKHDETQTLQLKNLQLEYDKYKTANVTLMEDNLVKEKEILRLNNTIKDFNEKEPPPIVEQKKAIAPKFEEPQLNPVRKVDIIYELNKIVGESRKSVKNDLTRILGIGETLEIKLNSFGIYSFKQVANIDDRAANLIEELTGFSKAKISDYKWVEQANNLK